MLGVATKPLVTVDGVTFDHADAVLAGLMTGAWQRCERRLSEALAAAGAAADADAAAELLAFRRERRLLAAEDLRAWLADRELTIEDLLAWVDRRQRRAATLPCDATATGDIGGLLRAEATLDGTLAGCAAALVERAVAARLLGAAAPPADAERARALAAEARSGPERGLSMLGDEELMERCRRIVALDCAHRDLREAVDRAALERELRARRLDMTRVRLAALALRTEDAAREAVLCITADGMALPQVAARADGECVVHEAEIGDLPGALRGAAAAAVPGELLGPVGDDSGFHVAVLRERRAPELGDPHVRARLCGRVFAARLERAAAGRVEHHGHV